MIYDCFLFNNELELLDIRLNMLKDAVDKFVITESTVTHTNEPKRLFYDENKSQFKQFRDKIIHNVITDSPSVSNPWIINDYQFSNMQRVLLKCNPQDIILFGDVDEIPRPERIREWINHDGILKVFAQAHCHYYLNFTNKEKDAWLGTRMMAYNVLRKYKTLWIARYSKYDIRINDGGWHFSYLGGVKRIQEKMRHSTHQEYNNDKYNTPEKIRLAMLGSKDIVGKGWKFYMKGDSFLPRYIIDNKSKFRNLLLEKKSTDTKLIEFKIILLKTAQWFRVKLLRKIKRGWGQLFLNE